MCPRDDVDISGPRMDDDNRLMGPPIILLEFEKGTLDPHIIIRGECIQLRIKKRERNYILKVPLV